MEVENLQLDTDIGRFFAIWRGYAELAETSCALLAVTRDYTHNYWERFVYKN